MYGYNPVSTSPVLIEKLTNEDKLGTYFISQPQDPTSFFPPVCRQGLRKHQAIFILAQQEEC